MSLIAFSLILYQELPVIFCLLLFIAWMTADAFVRAYFQWKHSDKPKQAILTLSENGDLDIGSHLSNLFRRL